MRPLAVHIEISTCTALRTWPEPPIWRTPAWSRLQHSTQLESHTVDHWHTFKLFCIPYSLQWGLAWMASLATTSFHPSHAKSAGSHSADGKWYSWSLVILIIRTARSGWTAKFTAFYRIILMHNDWYCDNLLSKFKKQSLDVNKMTSSYKASAHHMVRIYVYYYWSTITAHQMVMV